MTGPILSVRNLKKRFSGIRVLDGVSTDVGRGEITALIGSNGAGKSTLLNMISGLLTVDDGAIILDGRDITRLPSYVRARRGLARSFQHPRSFQTLSVLNSVLLGSTSPVDERLHRALFGALGLMKAAEQRNRDFTMRVLERCRLAHRANTIAAELTYGERKLLMLAQILAFGGELYCFDELCAGLEQDALQHVSHLFRELVSDGKSVLFIEHNLQLVRDLADRVIFLHAGEIFRDGETISVLEDPEVVRLYLGQ